MAMKRYWVTRTQSPHYGEVVMADLDGPGHTNPTTARVWLMDLTKPTTNMIVPRHWLTPWHLRVPGHQYCFCCRQDSPPNPVVSETTSSLEPHMDKTEARAHRWEAWINETFDAVASDPLFMGINNA